MWRQVSFMAEEKGSGWLQESGCEARCSGGYDSEEQRTASLVSSRGLSQPLEAVKNVPRSPNMSSSSRRGDSSDLVSERTPESSLAEEELLSPLLREWNSADDRELGVMSGNDRLLLRLGATSLGLNSPGVGTAVTSIPGDKVLLARLARFTEGGGGSSLGIICLHLQVEEQRYWSGKSDKNPLLVCMLRIFPVQASFWSFILSTIFLYQEPSLKPVFLSSSHIIPH